MRAALCHAEGWHAQLLRGCPLAYARSAKRPGPPVKLPAPSLPPGQVVRAADRALDAISGLSEGWAASIRRLKFEQHNRDWLSVVGAERGEQDAGGEAEGGEAEGEGGSGGCLMAGLQDATAFAAPAKAVLPAGVAQA